MKGMKKLIAVITSLVMILAMTTTAFAAQSYAVSNETDHSYAAYQIFAGTQEEGDNTGALAVSDWGAGVDGEALLDELTKVDDKGQAVYPIYKDCGTAADVANVLSKYADDTEVAETFAKLAYANKTSTSTLIAAGAESVNLDAGYYLIVDTTNTSGQDDAKNLALLQVTGKGAITIKDKSGTPTVEKKVYEESIEEYNDVADYDIGDAVPFRLTGTMPTDIGSYDSYKYVFHDKMDDTLSFNSDSVKVTIDGNVVDSSTYSVVFDDPDTTETNEGPTDECTFEVVFTDILSATSNGEKINITKDSTVVVDFTAELTVNAVIGLSGQENKVMLEYSNDVNVGGSGETGKTPWDTVIVFTYELDITKTNEDGTKKLDGAEFQILKDGKYAQFDENGKVTDWTDDADDDTTVLTSAKDTGLIQAIGLDEGTYILHEKTAPEGYVAAADKTLVITASTGNVQNYKEEGGTADASAVLTTLTLKVDDGAEIEGTPETGVVSASITNTKGGELPETGGMGTTIFYILGGILVACAGVLLVTKKRMGANN